MNFLINIKR